jgi:hypothetical protein
MPFSFTATIYKVGINPCVPVPQRITDKMLPTKGYIPIKERSMDMHLYKHWFRLKEKNTVCM